MENFHQHKITVSRKQIRKIKAFQLIKIESEIVSCSVMSDFLRHHGLVAYQASPSMGFSSQEYWSGLPFLSPADLPDPGIKPRSPALQADALPSEPPGKPKLKLY